MNYIKIKEYNRFLAGEYRTIKELAETKDNMVYAHYIKVNGVYVVVTDDENVSLMERGKFEKIYTCLQHEQPKRSNLFYSLVSYGWMFFGGLIGGIIANTVLYFIAIYS